MRNYVLLFIALFSMTIFYGRVSAQTCTPSAPVCVPANGYAFQYFADTDYGLRFNTTTAEYQFTNAAGVGLFNIHANNGLVTVKEELQVDKKLGVGLGNPMAVDFSVFDGIGHFGVPAGYAQFDNDGDLEFIGTADYLVDGNRYAFRYKAAPGYGLFFNATDSRYEFRTLNSSAVSFINANSGDGYFKGSLGVGITSPVAKLDVNGSVRLNGNVGIGTAPQSNIPLKIVAAPTNLGLRIDENDGTPGWEMFVDNFGLNYCESGVACDRLVIRKGGKIGMGTFNPSFNLDVRGATTDSDAILQLANSDESHFLRLFAGRLNDPNPFIQWKAGDPLRFATDNGGFEEQMRIDTNGSVGINTTSPTHKLDVNGRTRVRDLPLDNALENLVVADANGLLHTRTYESLNDGDWTKDPFTADHYFNRNANFQIGWDSMINVRFNVKDDGLYGNFTTAAIRGEGRLGPTVGYLGVQGQVSYFQDPSLSLSGQEIGVLGRSTGLSSGDNYGVFGHSNGWGGRFQHTDGSTVSNVIQLGGAGSEIQVPDGRLNISLSSLLIGNSLTGNGNKMIFDNSKAGAFRVGNSNPFGGTGTAWDPDSIGDGSFAGGFASKATGTESFAFGEVCVAKGPASVAMGVRSKATKQTSFALGFNVTSSAVYATATGINITAANFGELHNSGNIRASGTILTSDIRYKKEVKNISNALDKILLLQGVSYKYKTDEFERFNADKNVDQIGFIAQDVQKVLPELVSGDGTKENYLGIRYANLTAVIVEAIKEQQTQIEELKTPEDQTEDIEALKNENAEMKDRLTKIEQMLLQFDISLDECCSNHQQQGNEVPSFDQPSLGQNVPNPFKTSTIIPYYIPENAESAYMIVNNIEGQELRNYSIDQYGLGNVTFQTHDLSAGTYMYTLFVDGEIVDSKLMIVN